MSATLTLVRIHMAKGKYAQKFANQYHQGASVLLGITVKRPIHHANHCSVPVNRNLLLVIFNPRGSNVIFCLYFEETCKDKKCGPNEMCVTCEPNACNTFSCDNPDGKGIFCPAICKPIPPTCICKANYRRESPGAPCTPLECSCASKEPERKLNSISIFLAFLSEWTVDGKTWTVFLNSVFQSSNLRKIS